MVPEADLNPHMVAHTDFESGASAIPLRHFDISHLAFPDELGALTLQENGLSDW